MTSRHSPPWRARSQSGSWWRKGPGSAILYWRGYAKPVLQASRRSRPIRVQALYHGAGRRIGFLPVDAPVFQLFQRDRHAGHGAAHEGAGAHDAEIAVEVFELG